MFNQLHVFTSPQYINEKPIEKADIQIREVTKSAEKLKWMERFLKS